MLIAEEEPDCSLFGHIHADELHRRLKVGSLLILRIARYEDDANIGTDFSYAEHQFREEITGMMASETSRSSCTDPTGVDILIRLAHQNQFVSRT